MPYERKFGTGHPGCFIFLLDQSGSMDRTFAGGRLGEGKMLQDMVATVLNSCIYEIGRRCTNEDEVRHRADIAIVGYGKGNTVQNLLPNAPSHTEWMKIGDLMNSPLDVERRKKKDVDETGQIIEFEVRFPVWVKPVADSGTPMCAALRSAAEIAQHWIADSDHRHLFPPVVINITDGEATDGDPLLPATELRSLETNDGNVLLFNCHISPTGASECLYPAPGDPLPSDPFAKALFEMSSDIPLTMLTLARELVRPDIQPGARGFVFNADISGVTQMLQFVTVQKLTADTRDESSQLR